ncbi:MAG: Wzy polymerase domain-containing protein [Alteromonadaceae bacterium]
MLETPGGTGLYLSFNVFGWLIATILISLGLWQITLNKIVVTSKLHLYSLLGFFCLCIPMFYGSEFSDHAIPRLLGLAGGLLLLFCLYQFDELTNNPQQILWWILIAVALQSSFGLVQYFILETGDWGSYNQEIGLPHGSFLQRNVMASFMGVGISLSLYLATIGECERYSALKRILLYLTLFSSSFLIIPLFSRTGYLAALIAILFITPYVFLTNKKQFTKLLLIVISALFLAQLSLKDKPSNQVERKGTNINARSDIYLISLKMILDKPLFGFGYGGFERSYLDFNNKLKLKNPELNQPLLKLSHPHNEVLYWVSEGGIVAFLGMIFFFIAYMSSWLKIDKNSAKRLAILGLITPLLLHSQLEFPFYTSISHWFVFIILLWFTDIQSSGDKNKISFNKTFLLRFFAVLLPVIFLPFLVTTLQTGLIITAYEKNSHQAIKSFQKINNPLAWQSRFDANIYNHLLITGIKEKNTGKLQQFIDWGLIRVRFKPRPSVYSNVLLCLRILEKLEQYQEVLSEAKNTFPLIDNWGENLKFNDIKN